jgi:hypothetical protein
MLKGDARFCRLYWLMVLRKSAELFIAWLATLMLRRNHLPGNLFVTVSILGLRGLQHSQNMMDFCVQLRQRTCRSAIHLDAELIHSNEHNHVFPPDTAPKHPAIASGLSCGCIVRRWDDMLMTENRIWKLDVVCKEFTLYSNAMMEILQYRIRIQCFCAQFNFVSLSDTVESFFESCFFKPIRYFCAILRFLARRVNFLLFL